MVGYSEIPIWIIEELANASDTHFDNRGGARVAAPLAGGDVFVAEDLLKQYTEGVESFFGKVAELFAAHADEDS
jgi:hypothetical protein